MFTLLCNVLLGQLAIMLNRRHLRIKILHVLLATIKTRTAMSNAPVKPRPQHAENARAVPHVARHDWIDAGFGHRPHRSGIQKQLPSPEDLNPNTKFVTNKPLRILANSKNLRKACDELGVGWGNRQELLRAIFRGLLDNEEYQEYMATEERGFQVDRESLVRMFRKHMVNFEMFQDMLEEESIYWVDDLDLAASMVIKTIKTIKEGDEEVNVLPLVA